MRTQVPVECLEKGIGRAEAQSRIGRQRLQDERIELGIELRPVATRRRRPEAPRELHGVGAAYRDGATAQQLPADDTEREQLGARIIVATGCHLRRQEAWRGPGQPVRTVPRQPEVGNLELLDLRLEPARPLRHPGRGTLQLPGRVRDEEMLGLQIAMQDTSPMQEREPLGRRPQRQQRVPRREPADQPPDAGPRNVLEQEADERPPVEGHDLHRPHQPRVREFQQALGLPAQRVGLIAIIEAA
ncbi:MAG: hypothetical protein PVF43_00535 [Candidatus Eiseniibacteriota bacterium]